MLAALRNVGGGDGAATADGVAVAGQAQAQAGSERREAAATAGTPADHVLSHGSAGSAGERRLQRDGGDGRRRGDGSSSTQ